MELTFFITDDRYTNVIVPVNREEKTVKFNQKKKKNVKIIRVM